MELGLREVKTEEAGCWESEPWAEVQAGPHLGAGGEAEESKPAVESQKPHSPPALSSPSCVQISSPSLSFSSSLRVFVRTS